MSHDQRQAKLQEVKEAIARQFAEKPGAPPVSADDLDNCVKMRKSRSLALASGLDKINVIAVEGKPYVEALIQSGLAPKNAKNKFMTDDSRQMYFDCLQDEQGRVLS